MPGHCTLGHVSRAINNSLSSIHPQISSRPGCFTNDQGWTESCGFLSHSCIILFLFLLLSLAPIFPLLVFFVPSVSHLLFPASYFLISIAFPLNFFKYLLHFEAKSPFPVIPHPPSVSSYFLFGHFKPFKGKLQAVLALKINNRTMEENLRNP